MKNAKYKNWLALASNSSQDSRLLALELIPSVANNIQEELIMWYAYNETSSFRAKIFENLDHNSKTKITKLNLGKIEKFNFVREYPERLVFGEKIRIYILERKEINRISLIKEYCDVAECGLKDAIIAIHNLESSIGNVY